MNTLPSWLSRCPLVAILRGVTPDEVVPIGEALVEAGFAIIEVPLNSPDPFESIRRLIDRFGGDALVGAGTVLDIASVRQVAEAGGRLVVMPHADRSVIEAAKAARMIALPGCFTATEAFAAIGAGAEGLKLFPAEIAGPKGLKALRAVLPSDLPVLPVGGITPEAMEGWWPAGASGFGLGSALYKPGDNVDTVRAHAMAFRDALARSRGIAPA